LRFLADKYKLDMSSAANSNNLANAIKRGHEKGDLNLPKGIGGRVKMPAKVCDILPFKVTLLIPSKKTSAAGKENAPPTKPAAKPAAAKRAAPAKKAAAPVKKPAHVKKPAATKTATKSAAPKPAKTVTKKPAAKKTSAPKKAPAGMSSLLFDFAH